MKAIKIFEQSIRNREYMKKHIRVLYKNWFIWKHNNKKKSNIDVTHIFSCTNVYRVPRPLALTLYKLIFVVFFYN